MTPPPAPFDRLDELLAFRAPYLEDKLVMEKITDSREEARALFEEVKKYLALSALDRRVMIPMFSRRVDEAWHQFVLFTVEYSRFSKQFFDRYAHHAPRGSPPQPGRPAKGELTREEFETLYRSYFGEPSLLWHDEHSVRPRTRMLRLAFRRPLSVQIDGDFARLVLERDPPVQMLSADARAAAALRFAISHPSFYVRELPGLRDADERVELCRGLARAHVARILS